MKLYNVYQHPILKEYVVVKQGFSFPALLFGVLWTIYNKLWLHSGVLIAISLLLGFSQDFMNSNQYTEFLLFAVNLAVAVYVAKNANGWKSVDLQHRGFEEVAKLVEANNKEHALSKVDKIKGE